MPRVQLTDQQMFISKLAETAINTPRILTAEHVGFKANSSMPLIPFLNLIPDEMIGDGTEVSMNLRGGWWRPMQITVAGLLNCEWAARFGNRALGGTRTVSSPIVTGVYDVTTNTQTKAQGRIPKLTTMGYDMGGYDFVIPSLGVNTMEIAFEGDNNVTFNTNLINTGLWRRNALSADLQATDMTESLSDAVEIDPVIVPPDVPAYHLMHPAATRVTFSNGTTIDFAADGDLISGSCNLVNNIVVRGLPGDPFIDPSDRKSGAYARDIHRGKRAMQPKLKVALDADLKAFVLMMNRTNVTNLEYLFRSDEKIGATDEYFELGWTYPLSQIMAVESDTDSEDAALSISFYPKRDPVSLGYVNQRIRVGDNTIQ